jgi:prophage regulatory protein
MSAMITSELDLLRRLVAQPCWVHRRLTKSLMSFERYNLCTAPPHGRRRRRLWEFRSRFSGVLSAAPAAPLTQGAAAVLASSDRISNLAQRNPDRGRIAHMPDTPERILRIKAVLDRTGLTRSTLYRKIQDGTFPKQVRLSARCAGWHESAVNAWLLDPMLYCVADDPNGSASLAKPVHQTQLRQRAAGSDQPMLPLALDVSRRRPSTSASPRKQ